MSEPSPRDREFTYTHIWPIVDDSLPASALKVEAARVLGPTLGLLGVRPTRRPRFTVADDRLVAEVPVLRLDGDEPVDTDGAAVLRALAAGKEDGHIAGELGVPRSFVEEIRTRVEEAAGEPAEAGVAG